MTAGDEGRRFNAEETALILRRATELKPSVPERIDALSRDGITLADLAAAAAEAGIDPGAVRVAALELDSPPALRASRFHGAPTRLVEERVIDRVIGADEFDAFADEVRRAVGITGALTLTPRAVTWSSLAPGSGGPTDRRLAVTLVVRGESTILRAEEDLDPETVLTTLGTIVGGGVGGLAAGLGLAAVSPILALATPLVPFAAWLGMRRVYRRLFANRQRDVSQLATYLALRAREPLR